MKSKSKPELFFFISILIFSLMVLNSLSAQPKAINENSTPSKERSKWTPEDILLAESASGWEISPDGKFAVWIKSRMDKEKNSRISNLFLTDLLTKKEIQLTRGTDNYSRPKWSPKGELISFLSTRALPKPNPDLAGTQLWLINSSGGEPYPVTELARGINNYFWADDNTIIFSAQEDPTYYEQELKRKKDASRVVDDVEHEPPVRLFKFEIKEKKITRLTDNTDFISVWALSPDGKLAVTSHEQYLSFEWDHKTLPKIFLYQLDNGKSQPLFSGQRIVPQEFRWTRDGKGFYFIAPYSTHPKFFTAAINLLYYYDLQRGELIKVDLDWENGLGRNKIEVTEDGFMALLADGVRFKPARFVKSGLRWKRSDLTGTQVRNIFDFTVSRDGKKIVYEYSTSSTPEQWFVASLAGTALIKPEVLTNLNPAFKDKTPARAEIIRWKGALGEEVEGLLYYPADYKPGEKYPLFTAPHGGPAAADLDAWDESYAYPTQLITQRGAFVFKPNYHGSANYGLKFVESICCGKYYEYPVEDIEKGVDHLISLGLVDPEKIGTFGWSNGSILSIALSVHNPKRYKVVGAGAGNVEFISDWANVEFGESFDSYYFGKSPLEDPELYVKLSPFFKLDRVEAPTIIFFGTEDRNVPTGQGWSHYRALYHLSKAPVKFILFPGEAHGLRQFSHQLRKMEEELAWFDRHFFKVELAKNEAFKKDSPLGWALELKKAARVNKLYGVMTSNGTLVPEVVRRGKVEIGRFEITRAQYAAFDPSFKFEPGTENYPANGISQDKARAYVEWLIKLTGEKWRLLKEDEMLGFYESQSSENTLDFWAGYSLNPDDARRLEAKVRALGEGARLLKEAGNFPGAGKEGEDYIYDLGGNAAEWVTGKDGSLKVAGGSADRPADARARAKEPAPEYIGFRVAREK